MFSRRIVLESLRSQWKATCRCSSTNKAPLLFSGGATTSTKAAVVSHGVRGISGTSTRVSDQVMISQTKGEETTKPASPKDDKVVVEACGDVDGDEDDDSDDEEEMFVEAHESFEHKMTEWGGPRRGGRLPEPTRFGDWERKGRCSDF